MAGISLATCMTSSAMFNKPVRHPSRLRNSIWINCSNSDEVDVTEVGLSYTIKKAQLQYVLTSVLCMFVHVHVSSHHHLNAVNTASTSSSANGPSSLCLPHFGCVLLFNWAIVILFCLFPTSVPKSS